MKILSYVVLTLFLVFAGVAAVYFFKSKAQDAKISVLQNDLNIAERSLFDVKRSVETSDKIIETLTRGMAQVDERDYAVRQRITMLERNNEEIRRFLNTSLPESACVLDNTCSAPDVSNAKRSVVTPLPVTKATKKR